jgi:metal-dependent HD superfamily phosphatase/phosphodiesterase
VDDDRAQPAAPEPPHSPREALAEMRIRAPAQRNPKLEALIAAVNGDDQVKAWWHAAAVNATRLGMSDHSWVHIQIVLNIALRLARLLFRAGVTPSVVSDHSLRQEDAEVIIAAASLFHCVGMSIHRADHESFSLFLTADKLGSLLSGVYDEPERSIVVSEAMHAIIAHRSHGAPPFTLEAGIVRVADALDMARGRSRVPFEAGHHNIHSLSAYAIQEVKIEPGEERPVLVQIAMSNSAGIFQVDELLANKLRGSKLEDYIEVVARIEGEHEERLLPVFRI